jgi:hypothetical protein
MGDRLSVDTDGLARAMPAFQELGDRMASVAKSLEAKLSALGEPWGEDRTGGDVLRQYQFPKEELLTGIADTGQVLGSTAEGVTTMAKGFAKLEENNLDAVRNLTAGGPHAGDGPSGKAPGGTGHGRP